MAGLIWCCGRCRVRPGVWDDDQHRFDRPELVGLKILEAERKRLEAELSADP
jgi:hypothetical protein